MTSQSLMIDLKSGKEHWGGLLYLIYTFFLFYSMSLFERLLTCVSVYTIFGRRMSEEMRSLSSLIDPIRHAVKQQLRTYT